VLTVDYDRLGLRRGETMLDLGCGGGRHAFEALRRGARVVALDADQVEVKDAANLMDAMEDAGEIEPGQGAMVNGNALTLPFPDASFDRVIAAEVLEHIPDDVDAIAELARVLKRGGTMAVTVPRWYPELVNWALSDEYHSVKGGHVRIYRKQVLEARLRSVGLEVRGSHHAHALHSPYWWLKCAVGTTNDTHRAVRAYHRMLVWDITKAPKVTRVADRVLNPVLGKSLVVYAVKP
jgi:SAM-dependent methyltransferase